MTVSFKGGPGESRCFVFFCFAKSHKEDIFMRKICEEQASRYVASSISIWPSDW